jgi:hypothetical protein
MNMNRASSTERAFVTGLGHFLGKSFSFMPSIERGFEVDGEINGKSREIVVVIEIIELEVLTYFTS